MFKITRSDITESLKIFNYSDIELYHTVKTDNKGKQVFDGDISGYIILNEVDSAITPDEYDDWKSSVKKFINDHNKAVRQDKTGNTVSFTILDSDSRHAYKYIEYINGKENKSGTGFSKDFETKAEKKAWIEAVKNFRNEKNEKTPTQTIKDGTEEIDKSIDKLDDSLPEQPNPIAPLIITTLPEIVTKPCDFSSDLKQSTTLAIPLIDGVPSPKDMATYAATTSKRTVQISATKTADASKHTTKSAFAPIKAALNKLGDYFSDLDALYDEYKKRFNSEIVLFKQWLKKPNDKERKAKLKSKLKSLSDDVHDTLMKIMYFDAVVELLNASGNLKGTKQSTWRNILDKIRNLIKIDTSNNANIRDTLKKLLPAIGLMAGTMVAMKMLEKSETEAAEPTYSVDNQDIMSGEDAAKLNKKSFDKMKRKSIVLQMCDNKQNGFSLNG